jgi:predicted acylesterase/phospholipase RssA
MANPTRGSEQAECRVGLALAGGGPAGAIYELGALRALEEAVDELDLNNLCVYVGVSAGAFISANIANHLTTTQMCRAVLKYQPGDNPFVPETFLTPAMNEWLRRGASVPRLFVESLWKYARNPRDLTVVESLMHLSRALPVGLFDNQPVADYMERILQHPGRTNNFGELDKKLILVAADLDSGQSVRFGEAPFDKVPISLAVQASTALPGLYPPVEIEGRHYVDGVLLKTMHASVALDAGARLLFCLNPIVPVDTAQAVSEGVMKRGKLIHRGLPTVLSQALRTVIRSRLGAGFESYQEKYPEADVFLFEPPSDDYRMFFTNVFAFSSRVLILDHAYRAMRRQLLERQDELAPALQRHGMRLRVDFLAEEERTVWDSVGWQDRRGPHGVLNRLASALDRLEEEVEQRAS